MTRQPLRVLCLDIEGGYGGSSRSLYQSILHLDRQAVEVEVWCKCQGPIQEAYAALGVPCRVMPTMPKVSALPRFSRNLYAHARHWLDFWRASSFRRELARGAGQFDVVHMNHESLARLAAWLRSRTRAAITVHNRTMLWDTPFSRRQVRCMARAASRLVFISENERDNVRRLGCVIPGRVIYNIVEVPQSLPPAHPQILLDRRFRVASLANCSWGRGTDRLIEVASALASRGRRDLLFVVAGKTDLSGSMPGEAGRIGRKGGTLVDYAANRGVADMFLFLGHVADPERVLAACHALIKPTREANPWGRDILESLAFGCPVLSCGTYERFVENGVTGFLYQEYDPHRMAADLLSLVDEPARCRALGRAAVEKVRLFGDGPANAAALAAVWQEAYDDR